MFRTNNRYKNQRTYNKEKYNKLVNQSKKVNKVLNQRGGIKL